MATSRELDYDEDDYLPPGYTPPKSRGRGRKPLVAVVVVGLIFGAFMVSFVMRSRVSRRDAEIGRVRSEQEAMIAVQRANAMRPPGLAGDAIPGTPSSNWMRVIGTWRREPSGEDDGLHPSRFDFRPELVASVGQHNAAGNTVVREGRVEVVRDEESELELQIRFPNEVTVYRFQLRMDGVLLLDDGRGGVAFSRLRSQLPAPPPVDDRPPR